MKRKFLFVCLAAFALCGCPRKETCSQNELVEAPPEFLQYWYFPKGSYWVYQLKDTVGVYDTVTVVNDYKRYCDGTDPNNPDCDQPDCVWMYSNTWQHSNYDYFGGNKQYPPMQGNTSYYMGNYWLVSSYPMGVGHYIASSTFQYPYSVGDATNDFNVLSESTITTNVETFPNTLEIELYYPSGFDTVNNQYLKKIFITPQKGVVRWNYAHNRVWELISYDVTP